MTQIKGGRASRDVGKNHAPGGTETKALDEQAAIKELLMFGTVHSPPTAKSGHNRSFRFVDANVSFRIS